jgi:hypothetical protein
MTTREWTLVVWALLGVAFAALLVISHLSEGRFPTLSSTIRRLTARPVGRGLLLLGWMWLGWHAFAR